MSDFDNHRRIIVSTNFQQLSILLCFSLLTAVLSSCSNQSQSSPAAGDVFPLTLLTQMKTIQNSSIDIQNKTLLINFWATWCKPCRDEMPGLQELSTTLDQQQYTVIGISVDDDINLIKEFLLQHKIKFSNFQDKDSQMSEKLLSIKALPVTFIVSAEGLIINRITGEQHWDVNFFNSIEQGTLMKMENLNKHKKSG